jgi:hypothetical protein
MFSSNFHKDFSVKEHNRIPVPNITEGKVGKPGVACKGNLLGACSWSRGETIGAAMPRSKKG